ncbi:methyltransferase domain-containing protein [Candidatus Dojkabacteria bacterium]|jgi:protein-L-isoaspartate(D-aspartate) O-methyltransferase|nr:methyltransferase domain-containing protein [Candidatus Dojkabacteria bacterium]
MKIQNFGTGAVFKWTKEYLVQVLTDGANPIVTDPLLINALNKIDRKDFLPDTLKNQAYNDVELEIGYSEVLNKPTIIAQMLALLKPKYGGRYLDIGTGTGYSAMILAFVAGDEGHVYTIERVQWLWEQASTYAKKYKDINNIDFLYRDGMDGLPQKAPFDGIHIAFALESVPENLKMQLKVNGGLLVCPTTDMNLRVIQRTAIDQYEEEIVPGFIFNKGKVGLA